MDPPELLQAEPRSDSVQGMCDLEGEQLQDVDLGEQIGGIADSDVSEISSSEVADPFGRRSSNAGFSGIQSSGSTSPLGSPLQHHRRGPAVLPDASPELMRLLDSAIQGSDQGSLERLRRVVSGEEAFEADEQEDVETRSRLVVEILLTKMGGGEEAAEDSAPRMMLSVGAAMVAAQIVPWLPSEGDNVVPSPRTRMMKGFTSLLQACTRNRAMSSAAGILKLLLDSACTLFTTKSSPDWDPTPLLDALRALGSHSLAVGDLQHWLQAVTVTFSTGRCLLLAAALEKAVSGEETRGPSHTFEFDGESSGLLGPGESRWPFVSGYAFATWLYIESFADTLNAAAAAAAIAAAAVVKTGKTSAMSAAAVASALAGEGTAHMPRLFSFLSVDNQGVEAYFHGQFLVLDSVNAKGRKSSLHFTFAFQPRRWYFVGLEHSCKQSLIGKSESEVRLYVDGKLYESRPFEFPRVSKALGFCCIGTNPPPAMAGLQRRRRQCPLFAEMGPVYIFKEPVGPEKMRRLAARGGDVLPSFGNGAGSCWLATSEQSLHLGEESVALDAELAPKLHLLYHPKLLVGRLCMDASPSGASGLHRKPAEVLGHVHVAARTRPVEALWAMAEGGPMALLPLVVGNVNKESWQPTLRDVSSTSVLLSGSVLRILAACLRYPGNAEEMMKSHSAHLLAHLLGHLLLVSSHKKDHDEQDEELVAAAVSLCQSPSENAALKVHLYSCLLLDLKLWSGCAYGLQKKLLSSLADMVFTEEPTMRAANAVQMLLDGCRQCYWITAEPHSVHSFAGSRTSRPVGEINALVDELLVVVELLVGSAQATAAADVRYLVQFVLDCPQPNQVARVLHLMYRLVVQPNAARAAAIAELLIANGGAEMLMALIQRESEIGEQNRGMSLREEEEYEEEDEKEEEQVNNEDADPKYAINDEPPSVKPISSQRFLGDKNLGGIALSISADTARNNFRNVDKGDGIMIGIVGLLGAFLAGGHLKGVSAPFGQIPASENVEPGTVSWLLYALQRAFQSAPKRLFTGSVYSALLAVVVRSEAASTSSTEDRLSMFDTVHRFEHMQVFVALLRSLPYASREIQLRGLQDILLLACTHADNRTRLTAMPEWPEWLLEILISNYEPGLRQLQEGLTSFQDVEELIYSFLTIMLEHSMRSKDGWKDIEAAIHCAEWLAFFAGPAVGEQRIRREEALPVIKRRLLGDLLDFAVRELQKQAHAVAAAAAGASNLSPRTARAEAEAAASFSMSLAENSLVLLMLVEDHLRLQCQAYNSSLQSGSLSVGSVSPRASSMSTFYSFGRASFDGGELLGSRRLSSASDSGGLPVEVLTSMADSNGQVSVNAIERLTASAGAEPFESVRCAFCAYGSCGAELSEGWKTRSRMWYGVGLPAKGISFGGGGGGWDSWNAALEKDPSGTWVELPLIRKSLSMLRALLLDDGGAVGAGFGGGAGASGIGLQQLLDSDQPFYTMLRMVLSALKEEDFGVEIRDERASESLKTMSALLWCVLTPLLTMPLSESKRQRVLVASSILYSEVWHAISSDRKVLRKQYLEAIVPPFTALLRRWRPLLSGVHELTDSEGQSPLSVEDRSLATDASPSEAALAMVSPTWAAAFASPPVSMALAMAAAGVAGGETSGSKGLNTKRESLSDRKFLRFRTFSAFQKPTAAPEPRPVLTSEPKDKAGAKAAALAAARDQERAAKIGSGRGLAAVAMATSTQRRSVADRERWKRWHLIEAMTSAWQEYFGEHGHTSSDKDNLTRAFISLSTIMSTSKAMQATEYERRRIVVASDAFGLANGSRAWVSLLRRLFEVDALYGPLRTQITISRVFWKLDPTENSLRMRRRLKRNYHGSDHYGAAADYREPQASTEENGPSLSDTILNSGAPALMPEAAALEEAGEEDIGDGEFRREEFEYPSPTKPPENEQNATGVPFTSASKERLLLEVSAVLVQPLRNVGGVFQVSTKHICFSTDLSDPSAKVKAKLWPITLLKEIHSRRYLLRKSALELFMSDMSNHFFDFESSEQKQRVYKAILQARPPHLNTIYASTQRPERLLKRTQLMEQWAHRQISNFEYLIRLNTIAGRTYNDMTQYPVFPWVLSDYTSKELDLENPSIFRDLSKPVGALNPARLEKIMERYHGFEDPIIPKFHYGSHYSSAGTVLYYLTRVEPYTSLAIQLQGGKFDHADRMFSDLGSTWNGVLEDMSDVKELVPELFYMPEVFTNDSGFDLGRTQHGEELGNVRLPKWAKNPLDFVKKHRAALESEHVSAHLHEWIDLIFGYKQRGKEAAAAHNVFFYMTYEGAVDVDKIDDPVLRKATQDQIAYFGQTPSQLLTTPHMKRLPIKEVLHLQTIFRNPSSTLSYGVPFPERCNVPASKICAANDSIVTVDLNAPTFHVALHKWQQNTPDGQGMPFLFQHGKPSTGAGGGTIMRMFRGQPGSEDNIYPRVVALPAQGMRRDTLVAISTDGMLLFTGGHADNSLKLVAADSARVLETAYGHTRPVTCVGLSPDGTTLVTGSQDATAILWRINSGSTGSSSASSEASANGNASASVDVKKRLLEGPVHVLRGHSDELACCCIDMEQDLVVSSSQTGVLLHSATKGRFIRRIQVDRADILSLSPEGIIVVWDKVSRKLLTYTLNGLEVASSVLPARKGDVSCILTSADGLHIVVGFSCRRADSWPSSGDLRQSAAAETSSAMGAAPEICLMDIYTLQVVYTFRLHKDGDVTAMALSRDNTNLVVSTADAHLLVFTDPALSVRVVDQMLRLGWEGSAMAA